MRGLLQMLKDSLLNFKINLWRVGNLPSLFPLGNARKGEDDFIGVAFSRLSEKA